MVTNPPGYMGAYVKRERGKILKALGNKCAHCHCTTDLEIHHINGKLSPLRKDRTGGTYGWDRIMEWKTSLDVGNLTLLCGEHHAAFHRGEITLSKYKTISHSKAHISVGA